MLELRQEGAAGADGEREGREEGSGCVRHGEVGREGGWGGGRRGGKGFEVYLDGMLAIGYIDGGERCQVIPGW